MKHQKSKSRLDVTRIADSLQRLVILRGISLANALGYLPMVSWLIVRGCHPLPGEWPNRGRRIWMLGKEGLTEDLLASLMEGRWAIPIDISRGIPKGIARKYLPLELDDNNYGQPGDEVDAAKAQYREAWQVIFRKLTVSSRPSAIATGNFGYYAEREMAQAAEQENIPFIAMHKECLKSEGRLAFFKTVYQRRGRFTGRKILVYNQRERDLQLESGVARSDQVVVCGMPRLDRLHHWRLQGQLRPDRPPTLLAFGFTPQTGLPRIPHKGETGGPTQFEYLDPEHESLGWDRFFHNYHEVLVKIARDNPDWIVKLKLKARHRDADPSIRLMQELNAPENVQLVVGDDPLQYIMQADVICGFNTTAILEGLAAGLPVVTPAFDEVVDPKMRDYAASFGNATYTPDDPESTYRLLTELMSRPVTPEKSLRPEVSEILDLWVGNPDGRASDRVRQVFEHEMTSGS